ncbi:hypothetical protein [Rickettsiella endosymbiont of Dermanyssus gallinae]|uniref:hypothetical protein n=1 Tax=Rickettsiella endosymbiont of Dermanyssus gallinae TaxID=2856608 RepID=UPI001C5296FE|nr:hypothetical protein [Rickettsiella endosymbiont of Dermanyssus gallinae]
MAEILREHSDSLVACATIDCAYEEKFATVLEKIRHNHLEQTSITLYRICPSYNNFEKLAKALERNSTLDSLTLCPFICDTPADHHGIIALNKALAENTTLTSFTK